MARYKKNEQRYAQGCKICGDPSIGRGIDKHVEKHGITYATYKKCFDFYGEVVFDELKDTGKTAKNGTKRVILHVLVKRFEVDADTLE